MTREGGRGWPGRNTSWGFSGALLVPNLEITRRVRVAQPVELRKRVACSLWTFSSERRSGRQSETESGRWSRGEQGSSCSDEFLRAFGNIISLINNYAAREKRGRGKNEMEAESRAGIKWWNERYKTEREKGEDGGESAPCEIKKAAEKVKSRVKFFFFSTKDHSVKG